MIVTVTRGNQSKQYEADSRGELISQLYMDDMVPPREFASMAQVLRLHNFVQLDDMQFQFTEEQDNG